MRYMILYGVQLVRLVSQSPDSQFPVSTLVSQFLEAEGLIFEISTLGNEGIGTTLTVDGAAVAYLEHQIHQRTQPPDCLGESWQDLHL